MINKIGETSINKYGSKMTIIEYKNSKDITVEFENGYKTDTRYNEFKKGSVSNPYDKTIYNIGYIGEGEYKVSVNKKHTIQYNHWINMLQRCYSEYELKRNPTYGDKYVCEKWSNFQVFAKWFDENYYEIEGETMCLDKDILCKGNRIYSPETCVFVPNRINSLFLKRQNDRGEYPIGISYFNNKFRAKCRILEQKHQKHIGYYDTPEEAFYNGYKPFKEAYIKEVAELYKYKIPLILYNAMYRYVVEIDD